MGERWTSKTVNGVLHEYVLNGSQILAEKVGNALYVYLYDESGSSIGFRYRTALVDGVPVVAGGDFNIIPDEEKNRTYYGVTQTKGVGIGKPGVECHIEWGMTSTMPKMQFNIYEVARNVYDAIMRW